MTLVSDKTSTMVDKARVIKLYHFPHCPYCIRVRLALGYLKLPYESVVVAYDDAATPLALTGVKMLPIATMANGTSINESLSIVSGLPGSEKIIKAASLTKEAEEFTKKLGNSIHPLAIPHWLMLPEFSNSAKAYFLAKQQQKRGTFLDILRDREAYEQQAKEALKALESHLVPFFKSNDFTLADIVLAAHLWALRIIPEFPIPHSIQRYLDEVAQICSFRYFADIWRSNECLRNITADPSIVIPEQSKIDFTQEIAQ